MILYDNKGGGKFAVPFIIIEMSFRNLTQP